MVDLTGRVFSDLTVLGIASKGKNIRWLCRCACGAERSVLSHQLLNGATKSCGCYRRRFAAARARTEGPFYKGTHGMSYSAVYRVWSSMLARCRNPRHKFYSSYGGRGIAVCERWSQFENFLADMGECPKGMELDRIDNDGNYEPSNCRWADRTTQIRNRSNTIYATHEGITKPLGEWASALGVDYGVLHDRFKRTGKLILKPRSTDGTPA